MHLLLVLVICLALFPDQLGTPVSEPGWRLAGVLVSVALVGMVAELFSWSLVWQLAGNKPRRVVVRRYNVLRLIHLGLAFSLYLTTLYDLDGYGLAWAAVVRGNWELQHAVVIDEILILAPLLLTLLLSWASFYRVERALHATAIDVGEQLGDHPFWSRGTYVLFHVRHYLGLILAPILLFLAVHEAVLWGVPTLEHSVWFQLAAPAFMALGILLFMPWLLTVIWGTTSLPVGPLRERLVVAARRLGFRCTDILLWNTRGGVANAMVTGLLPFPRYVLLSDGLIEHLQPEEIEAVFGHEVGHVKHQHMPFYLAFIVLSLVLLFALVLPLREIGAEWLGPLGLSGSSAYPWAAQLAGLALLGTYIWLVFGFLSRRCERQADVFGARAISCSGGDCLLDGATHLIPNRGRAHQLCPRGIQTFIQALEKVAALNGIERDKPSWRHSSIAWRVGFLEGLLKDPAVEPRFQRRLAGIKWGLLASLTAIVALAAWLQWDTLEKLVQL